MKLSIKIPLILTTISIISTIFVFFFIFNSIRSDLETADAERQLILATETMDKIDLFLNERFNDIQPIATRTQVVDSLTGKNGFNKSVADRLTKSLRKQIVKNVLTNISVIDLNGKEIITTDDKLGSNIFNEDSIYTDLIERAKKGVPVYSDTYLSKEINLPTIVFITPVFSDTDNKNIIGFVEAHIDWGGVQSLLEGQQGPLAHLYNEQGFVIATSDFNQRSNVLKENNFQTSIFQAALKGDSSNVLPGTHDGTALVSHVHELGHGNYKGNGWILTLETPSNIAFAPAIKNGIQVGLITVPIILFATLITAFILYSSVIRPVNKLTEVTGEIAAGDLGKRVEINSNDELGILANSFNKMTATLQESYQNLENKVLEKTKDLEKKVEEADTAKKATLNVLEDLNEEKGRVEESRARDEAILANIGDGLIATDEKGIIKNINKAAQQMLGWKEEEAIGKKFTEILPLEDNKGVPVSDEQRPLMMALKGKTTTTLSFTEGYKISRKDKTKFATWDFASPVILNDKIIGGVVVFRDVTKETEIDRMKTEFISLASHQLRTPLSAIKWFVELLNETKLDKEQKDFSTNISLSTERMIELVNALLNVSRIESGRIIINPKPTNLGDLVKNEIKNLQQKIDERKLKLSINIPENLAEINIDPQLVREVYMNLLTNAIKYTPVNGKLNITLSVKDKDIVSDISDSGIGIPEADKKKVFTKFYRSAEAIKAEPNGNGLGLYLAKAIIESSGGKMWFESKEKEGTTFSFSLPLAGSKPKTGEVSLSSTSPLTVK